MVGAQRDVIARWGVALKFATDGRVLPGVVSIADVVCPRRGTRPKPSPLQNQENDDGLSRDNLQAYSLLQ